MAGECTSRRGFVKGIIPVCFATCAGLDCVSLLALTAGDKAPQPPRHKFDEPLGRQLTYRQRFEIEYGEHFIPYLKILEKEIGRAKLLESLKKLALSEAREYADLVRAHEKADLSVFKRHFSPTTPGMKNMITVEVLEDSDKVYEIRITECLWATVFREADAAAYGFAAVCSGDAPFARFVGPDLDMDLQGTLMEGKPFCILRYHVKA